LIAPLGYRSLYPMLASLAAMFAGEPPSSSVRRNDVLESQLRFGAFRRLLLQIGGANIAGADRALEHAYFVPQLAAGAGARFARAI